MANSLVSPDMLSHVHMHTTRDACLENMLASAFFCRYGYGTNQAIVVLGKSDHSPLMRLQHHIAPSFISGTAGDLDHLENYQHQSGLFLWMREGLLSM